MMRSALLAAGLLAAVVMPAASAEIELKAISGFPKNYIFTRSFESYIKKVNERGAGVVKVTLIGGVEAIPPRQQATALRNGIVDILYQPPNFYLGLIPEGDVFSATKRTPMELRANGGWNFISGVFKEKMKAHLLGWFDSGIGMNLFLATAPQQNADGSLNLTGMKLRSSPIFNEFFKELRATNVDMAPSEIYPALERGIINGLGTPIVTVLDFGWDKFLRYRVDPAFFQSDVLTIVNIDKWNSLPEPARKILQDTAVEFEKESYNYWQEEQQRVKKEQAEKGIKPFVLEGKAAEIFLKSAYGSSWARIEKTSPNAFSALRKYFGE